MIAKWRQYGVTYFAWLHREQSSFKTLYGLSFRNQRQLSATCCRTRVGRIFLCQFGKIATFFQHIIYRVGSVGNCRLLAVGSFLLECKQDMRTANQAATIFYSVSCFLINLPCLRFYVCIGNH